jgi:hypothetical protein
VQAFVQTFDVDYNIWKELAIQRSKGSTFAANNPDLIRLAWCVLLFAKTVMLFCVCAIY